MLWARVHLRHAQLPRDRKSDRGRPRDRGPLSLLAAPDLRCSAAVRLERRARARDVAPTSMDLALAALATLMTATRIQAEEQLLRASMPEYAAYAVRTKRLIPFVF